VGLARQPELAVVVASVAGGAEHAASGAVYGSHGAEGE
jgi:Ca2+/Na+ antiporter